MCKKLLARVLPVCTALVLAQGYVRAEPAEAPFVVIVHPSRTTTVYSRTFVAEAFLKKTTRWPTGDVVRPVDLVPEAPARERFSRDVLHKSVAEVRSYWQQSIFAGRELPPPEVGSDDDVVKYVLKYEGAIGYVSGRARLGGAKPVRLE